VTAPRAGPPVTAPRAGPPVTAPRAGPPVTAPRAGPPVTAPHAVAVVIPARDEEDAIEACLLSVRESLRHLPPTVETVLTVVLDRCVDDTPALVDALTADWPGAASLRVLGAGERRVAGLGDGSGPAHIVGGSGVGALRDLGVRDALDRLRHLPPGAVWLLHTDADTTVPPNWATAHVELAAAGAAGVAGTVELTEGLSSWAARRHEQLVVAGTDGDAHHHVYGANLGVRADAHLAVGGFPVDGAGEDHGLWQALGAAGYPLRRPSGLRVRTSSRTCGRASGGLADLLRDLHAAGRAGGL